MNTSAAIEGFIDVLQDPVVVCDPRDARIVHANEKALGILGCSLDRAREIHVGDTSPTESVADIREVALDLLSRAFFEEVRFMWSVRSMTTGSKAKVHVSLHPLEWRGERCVMAVGRELERGLCVSHPSGRAGRAETSPARDDLDESIVRLERMAELGLLACGTMHDVNNYLAIVLGHCDAINARSAHDPYVSRRIRSVVDAVRCAARLQHQVLGLAGEKPGGVNRMSLGEAVEGYSSILEMAASKKVSFVLDVSEEDCLVEFDPARLSEVLLNLVNNARDAMPKGGRLTIGVAPDESGEHARLWVSDTGTGISDHMLERIFEPFVTTKPHGQGTGLGLTMARRIVEEHGGRISISSTEGEGTRVEVLLPRIGDAV